MTSAIRKLTDVQRRQSETRTALARLDALAEDKRPADYSDQVAALEKQARELEPELRAALQAVDEEDAAARVKAAANDDPETRERIELRGRASFGRMLYGLLSGVRLVDGPEPEYRAALKVGEDRIPLDIFEQDRPAPAEARAITPAPATGTGVTVAPVQPFVFAPSIAPRLGIDMPTVGTGGYSEMTISTALTPEAEAKGDAADGTAAAFTPVQANPRRISARLSLAIEDVAQVGAANFEAALRAHTSAALSDAYDNQCINGNGTAPNVNGLINQLTNPADPTAVADFDAFVAAFADQLDGLWASMVAEVAIVANVDAYKLSAKTFRDRIIDQGQRGGVSLGDESFAAYAKRTMGGWWTSKRMPATASTIARGIVYRMGRPGLRTASHPTWGQLGVDDIYTNSASGQRHFTLHVLVGDKVLIVQPDAYDLAEFKVA